MTAHKFPPFSSRGAPEGRAASRFVEQTEWAVEGTYWPKAVASVEALMQRDGAHDFGHLGRVWHNARAIWSAEAASDERAWHRLAASVIFHDVINLAKDSPERSNASKLSADLAVEWLKGCADFDHEDLSVIHEAIWSHSFSAGRRASSLVGGILTDADRLDALGAIGIARTFHVGGVLGRGLFEPNDPLARARPVDDSTWSLDHFFAKLFTLPQTFYTERGRQLAAERVERMRDFVSQLASEASYG